MWKDGRPVEGPHPPIPVPGCARRCARRPLTGSRCPPAPERVRVIEIVPGQLITHARADDADDARGEVVADPERDLAKIAVVERHHATGRIGVGLVTGFGLRAGAFATTVAHDAHNIVAVGIDDASMTACAERLRALGGGIVVAGDGTVGGELALPVAGLLADAPGGGGRRRLEHLQELLRERGVTIDAPFMSLSFLALSVIPSLKITDRGLVDVERFELVPLGAGRIRVRVRISYGKLRVPVHRIEGDDVFACEVSVEVLGENFAPAVHGGRQLGRRRHGHDEELHPARGARVRGRPRSTASVAPRRAAARDLPGDARAARARRASCASTASASASSRARTTTTASRGWRRPRRRQRGPRRPRGCGC